MTELTPLIERLEAAEGGSRELDHLLDCVKNGWTYERAPRPGEGYAGFFATEEGRSVRVTNTPIYTTSLDAALALVERVLPGVAIRLDQTAEGHFWAGLAPKMIPTRGASLPLALCIALLRTLQSKAGSGLSPNSCD